MIKYMPYFDIKISVVLILASLFFSCSDEVVMKVGEDVPVAYCLLNHDDTCQYLRISKSYDSYTENYSTGSPDRPFLDIEAYLIEENDDGSQTYYEYEYLTSVLPDTQGIGRFPYDLFRVNYQVKKDQKYSLTLYQEKIHQINIGSTVTMESSIKIIDPIFVPGRLINITPSRDYTIRYSTVQNAFVYQATMYFEYDELIEGFPERRRISLPQDLDYPYDDRLRYLEHRVDGELFYKQLSNKIQKDKEIIRIPRSIGIMVTCCGEEVYLNIYADIHTNSFNIIDFGNIARSMGLFSSYNRAQIMDIPISPFMVDSLALSPITKELNFAADGMGF
jgi:hypothetical protein